MNFDGGSNDGVRPWLPIVLYLRHLRHLRINFSQTRRGKTGAKSSGLARLCEFLSTWSWVSQTEATPGDSQSRQRAKL